MARLRNEEKRFRMSLEEVLVHFHELEDPQEPINIRYSLASIVVISIMAILAGASGPTSIAT